jgi:hypothetical protein
MKMKISEAAKKLCPFMTEHMAMALNRTAHCATIECMGWATFKKDDPDLRHADGSPVEDDEGDCVLMNRKPTYFKLQETRR